MKKAKGIPMVTGGMQTAFQNCRGVILKAVIVELTDREGERKQQKKKAKNK